MRIKSFCHACQNDTQQDVDRITNLGRDVMVALTCSICDDGNLVFGDDR